MDHLQKPGGGRRSHKKLNLVKSGLGIFISTDMLFYFEIVKEVKAADRRMDGKKEYQEERDSWVCGSSDESAEVPRPH